MREKIIEYLNASCGTGKYYSSRIALLIKLKKTRMPFWATFPVPVLIETITELLKEDGIMVEEAA
jgi:hypothetical protein